MGWYGSGYGGWAPYVNVATRRRRAQKKMEALRKKGVDVQPVQIDGRKIAKSFWGEAWCTHLESFSDFENRLPRGRTYVRNGSVCHLEMAKGHIAAKVSGSELYDVKVTIKPLANKTWRAIQDRSSGQIGSLVELLQGRLSDHVMQVVTDRREGLFPQPGEMSFKCSCPDWAVMCKHVAAVLYGVGARLDSKPELLFTLRGVDHEELIAADAEKAVAAATSRGKSKRLAADNVGAVFGIELEGGPDGSRVPPAAASKKAEPRAAKKAPPQAAKRPKPQAAKKVARKAQPQAARQPASQATAEAAAKGSVRKTVAKRRTHAA